MMVLPYTGTGPHFAANGMIIESIKFNFILQQQSSHYSLLLGRQLSVCIIAGKVCVCVWGGGGADLISKLYRTARNMRLIIISFWLSMSESLMTELILP